MGSVTLVLSILAVVVIINAVNAAGTGSCPLPSKIYGCSPKCVQTYECSNGKVCCPNSCNAKSCVDLATFGSASTGNNKYSQSGGTGTYCNNEKCRPSEVCKMDPATRRMKCVRA